MELLSSSASHKPQIESSFNFTAPKFTFNTFKIKYPFKFRVPGHKLHRNSSISVHLPFSRSRISHISSQFGRPTRRRNSLRKKLVDDQVRQNNNPNPSSDSLSSNFQLDNPNNSSIIENLDASNLVEPKLDEVGKSELSNKLQKWVDQYNKDTAYWGVGSGHIFTVYHDLEWNVKRVLVHEEEIVKRIQAGKQEFGDPVDVNSKIMYAKGLAREMERGENVIARNSTIAKFVISGEDAGFVKAIRSIALQPEIIPVVTGYGKLVFCGLVAIWALTKLFTFGSKEQKLTELEKEMMRRKIKMRKERDNMPEKGMVEVIQEPYGPPEVSIEKPKLDRQELVRSILEAKTSKSKLLLEDSSSSQTSGVTNFDEKIHEITSMAREAREIEKGEGPIGNKTREEEKQPLDGVYSGDAVRFADSDEKMNAKDTLVNSVDKAEFDNPGVQYEMLPEKSTIEQSHSSLEIAEDRQPIVNGEVKHLSDSPIGELPVPTRPRLIRSVKEARQYLAKKDDSATVSSPSRDKLSDSQENQVMATDKLEPESGALDKTTDPLPSADIDEDLSPEIKEYDSTNESGFNKFEEEYKGHDLQIGQKFSSDDVDGCSEERPTVDKGKWLEKNFDEVEPIIKMIGDGFRDNYSIAREKASENAVTNVARFEYNEEDSEFEWMKDEDLKRIVFQVRENELTGRDPFYLMDAGDKAKFFKGLEKKVEKENKKLSQVHEYLHSNIENLDYGADGISLYDRPEKFIPRWKGPVPEKKPEFLNHFLEERKALFEGIAGTSDLTNKDEHNLTQKSSESTANKTTALSFSDNALGKNSQNKDPKSSKTIIEASDGSVRAGKKSGKEYWQHTKKLSRGFLESYNAEQDPEIKSIMKDMGKDLDRWITEEEIQEAGDLMTKLSEKNKKFVEKKISKIKREMEMFGPQAVVSKYREYADDREEDYLWWLDLPHILCIELYTTQNGKDEVGFYTLEMAADLELEPKPSHVIAFEDASDCKNLCYIIQAHLEMLGNGHAFVVARPPKDAFREAKANSFGVTVIRKRELKMNIDQTLEEVEEQIAEIGSKMYHDMIMKERSVDMSTLMKGALGFNGRTATTKRKRSKRKLKKLRKK